MNRKAEPRTRVTVEDLAAELVKKDTHGRFGLFERYGKQKPEIEAVPLLRQALADDYHATVKVAAHTLGKLGPAAIEAMPDLVEAAYRVDRVTNVPQAYPECLVAMVRIDPSYSDLLPLIKHFVGLDNWVPMSAALRALRAIGTPEALALLQRVARFWEPDLNQMQLRVMRELLEG